MLLIGSSYGRFFGYLMREWFGNVIRPGVYALVGASSMVGGITRMSMWVFLRIFIYSFRHPASATPFFSPSMCFPVWRNGFSFMEYLIQFCGLHGFSCFSPSFCLFVW